MSVMLCNTRTIPTAPPLEVRESWIERILAKVCRPSRAALANDAYDAGKAAGERLGRLLARDLYRALVEAAKQQDLTPAQLAEVAEFVDTQATEHLFGGAGR